MFFKLHRSLRRRDRHKRRSRACVRVAPRLARPAHAQRRLGRRVRTSLSSRYEEDVHVHAQMRVEDHVVLVQVVLDARRARTLAERLVVLVVSAAARIAPAAPADAPLRGLRLHLQHSLHQLLIIRPRNAELHVQVIPWHARRHRLQDRVLRLLHAQPELVDVWPSLVGPVVIN